VIPLTGKLATVPQPPSFTPPNPESFRLLLLGLTVLASLGSEIVEGRTISISGSSRPERDLRECLDDDECFERVETSERCECECEWCDLDDECLEWWLRRELEPAFEMLSLGATVSVSQLSMSRCLFLDLREM
jgi:hypothetical protein